MFNFGDKYMKQKNDDQLQNENSMYKFVEDFNKEISSTFFSTTNTTLPVIDVPQTRQTGESFQTKSKCSNLSLNNMLRKRTTTPPKQETKRPQPPKGNSSKDAKFTFLPVLQINNASKIVQRHPSVPTKQGGQTMDEPKSTGEMSTSRKDVNRNLTLITGNVNFVIKMNKLYADSDLLYEVYGRVLRTLQGKFPCEQIIFLRNETGPVLQAIFYEIDAQLSNVASGLDVRCVGKFKATSRLHAFKITPLHSSPKEESLSRLQNLCNFMNKIKGKNK